eukprot:502390-Pleurochrysis_carterae.AAC.1
MDWSERGAHLLAEEHHPRLDAEMQPGDAVARAQRLGRLEAVGAADGEHALRGAVGEDRRVGQPACAHAHMHTLALTPAHSRTYARMHAYMHARIHAHTQTHACMPQTRRLTGGAEAA